MNSQERTWKYLFVGPVMAATLVALGGAVASCQDASKCSALREKTYNDKRVWEACNVNDDCIKVGGQATDCTGVLTCNFAVNRRFRDVAEKAVIDIVADNAVCNYACSTPGCAEGELVQCEAVSKRCILIANTAPVPTTTPLVDSDVDVTIIPPSPSGDASDQ